MHIDLTDLPASERYRLLINLVIPRPIALITTRDATGQDNAAPFSFFNVLGEDPPLVVVSMNRRSDGRLKDTTRNMADRGEFVVNLVDEPIAEAMGICALEFPPDDSELDAAGLSLHPAVSVDAGLIAQSPVSLECRVHTSLDMGPERRVVLATVSWLHVRDGLIDPQNRRIRDDAYHPIGRLYARTYCTTRDRFALPGIAYDPVTRGWVRR